MSKANVTQGKRLNKNELLTVMDSFSRESPGIDGSKGSGNLKPFEPGTRPAEFSDFSLITLNEIGSLYSIIHAFISWRFNSQVIL